MNALSHNRKTWIAMLAKLVAPADPVAAGKALSDMLPLLVDFPDGAFTVDSLSHVARECRRLPSFSELCATLGAWWKEHRPPAPLMLPGPETAHLTATERAILTTFYRLKDEIIRQGRLDRVLHWYRLKFDGAYKHLAAHDPDVIDHLRQTRNPAADWSDPGKVLASARLVLSSEVKQLELGRALAGLVKRHAPLNVALLPPEWHPDA